MDPHSPTRAQPLTSNVDYFYSLPKIVSNYGSKRPPAWPEWFLSVGATGMLGRCGCWLKRRERKGRVGHLKQTHQSQGVTAAGEIALLVSVMSGQSLGLLGSEIGHAAPSERPPIPRTPIHPFLQSESWLTSLSRPHYLNSITIWMCMNAQTVWSDSQDEHLLFLFPAAHLAFAPAPRRTGDTLEDPKHLQYP